MRNFLKFATLYVALMSVEERFHEAQFWFEGDEVEAEDHLADDVQGDQFPYIPSEDEIPF